MVFGVKKGRMRRTLMRVENCRGYQFSQNKQNFAGARCECAVLAEATALLFQQTATALGHRNHSQRKGNFQDTVTSEHELPGQIVREKGRDVVPTTTMKLINRNNDSDADGFIVGAQLKTKKSKA